MGKILIKTKELSGLVSISQYNIRKYVREGILPAYKVGGRDYLFDLDEVLEVIKSKPVN